MRCPEDDEASLIVVDWTFYQDVATVAEGFIAVVGGDVYALLLNVGYSTKTISFCCLPVLDVTEIVGNSNSVVKTDLSTSGDRYEGTLDDDGC